MTHNLIRDDEEQKVQVEYNYHPFYPGAKENGLPLEPDEPEGVEVESVRDMTGNEIPLTNEERSSFEEAVLQYLNDQKAAALEDYYDARKERLCLC